MRSAELPGYSQNKMVSDMLVGSVKVDKFENLQCQEFVALHVSCVVGIAVYYGRVLILTVLLSYVV
jgi:hypothetical protein